MILMIQKLFLIRFSDRILKLLQLKQSHSNVAAVALVNINARVLWALGHKKESYQVSVNA
jgi:hypothetical protein